MTAKEKTINLIEMFASVQGETSLTGLPTAFVRLARCNLRCTWCDTTYSFGRGDPYTLEQIIDKVNEFGCKHVCITGGEPLLQENVYPLMTLLSDQGYSLSLETSGSICTKQVDPRVKVILDIKCPASGMSHKNHWENLQILKADDEIKFVIANADDYHYAKEVCERYNLIKDQRQILFSPAFGLLDPKSLVEWILKDKIPARLNLQIHKFIWSPDTKGV